MGRCGLRRKIGRERLVGGGRKDVRKEVKAGKENGDGDGGRETAERQGAG